MTSSPPIRVSAPIISSLEPEEQLEESTEQVSIPIISSSEPEPVSVPIISDLCNYALNLTNMHSYCPGNKNCANNKPSCGLNYNNISQKPDSVANTYRCSNPINVFGKTITAWNTLEKCPLNAELNKNKTQCFCKTDYISWTDKKSCIKQPPSTTTKICT